MLMYFRRFIFAFRHYAASSFSFSMLSSQLSLYFFWRCRFADYFLLLLFIFRLIFIAACLRFIVTFAATALR